MTRKASIERYEWLGLQAYNFVQTKARKIAATDPDLDEKVDRIAQKARCRLLKKVVATRTWLVPCLEGDVAAFPYSIAPKGCGAILPTTYLPEKPNTVFPRGHLAPTPRFLITLADGKTPTAQPNDTRFRDMLHRLRTQAFSTTSAASAKMARARTAIVVGTNQMESLDGTINEAFVTMMTTTKRVPNTACRRIGFMWRPVYQTSLKSHERISPRRAFTLLRQLSLPQAQAVRNHLETPEGRLHPNARAQIPYQRIRERILKAVQTRDFAEHFQQCTPSSPVHLVTMDNDFCGLRATGKRGFFEQVSQKITLPRPVSVIGVGYTAEPGEDPIIRTAVRVDMAVRAAMSSVIPFSAYYPEPFLFAILQEPDRAHHLSKLSFIGNGNALESRRLIENGQARGVFSNGTIFIKKGPPTTSPERWKTKSCTTRKELTPRDLKLKAVLKALRGLSQSHSHPKKWAEQVYVGLDFKHKQVRKVTTAMMLIFNVYDPISRMFARVGKYGTKVFDSVMKEHTEENSHDANLLTTAKGKLAALGMKDEMIEQVVKAAQASGLAIYGELQRAR